MLCCHSMLGNKRDWCFTCEFEGLVLKAKNGSSSLSPVRILSQIQTIGSSLNQGRQEDAHEFLRCTGSFLYISKYFICCSHAESAIVVAGMLLILYNQFA